MVFINACHKNKQHCCDVNSQQSIQQKTSSLSVAKLQTKDAITDIVSVIDVIRSADGSYADIVFSRHEIIFNTTDASLIAKSESALKSKSPISIVFDPNTSELLQINTPPENGISVFKSRELITNKGQQIQMSQLLANPGSIDNIAEMGVINTTTAGLTPAIPDMETAQMIFNYFSAQCCINPGPYTVDHCITFQYAADGCYARAHKMCWLLNNVYHYATQKVFSFSVGTTSGATNRLSVKAEKWCGRCINWWYHVTPLVTIITPTGPKAYVFDPAMFDQPVPLATWLHAQANPVCVTSGYHARVTSFNIQPTASYSPTSTTTFDTDPFYSSTNSTLVSYRYNHTCP